MKNKIVFWGSAALCFLVVLSSSAQGGLNDGLVGHWDFNENSSNTLHDHSGNEHNGQIYGATWTNGISGTTALYFDGFNNPLPLDPETDDYVEIVGTINLHLFSGFTLSVWACYSEYTDDACIIGKHDGWPNGYVLGVVDNKFQFYLQGTRLYTDDMYSDGRWHHLAGTYDGISHQQNFYVDGELVRSQTIIYNASNSANITIGKCSTAFDGKVDEARIYDRALSSTEIEQLYVPEPATILLLTLGGLALRRFRAS